VALRTAATLPLMLQLKLKQVPWDAAICTIAALHHLRITLDDGILLVRK